MRKTIRRKERNPQEIKALVAELDSSVLTAAELAKREGVTVGAVYQWKNKVRTLPVEPIEIVGASEFLSNPRQSSGIRLEIESIRCEVDPNFDQQTLIRVVETINQIFANSSC